MSQDHYAVLGISPDSDEKQIRSAYLELIRRYHPDASVSPEAGERASAINLAYVVLRDRDKRAQYDRVRGYRLPLRLLHHGLVNEIPHGRRLEPFVFVAVVGAAALGLWQYSSQLERSVPQAASLTIGENRSEAFDTSEPISLSEESLTGSVPVLPQVEVDVPGPLEEVAVAQVAPIDLPQDFDQTASSSLTTNLKSRRREAAAKAPASRRPSELLTSHEGKPMRPKRTCDELPRKAEARSCRIEMFAIIDRQLGALFAEAFAKTDEARRTRLFESRHRFLDGLSSCVSDDCVRQVYIARSQEVASIAFASDGARGN